GMFAEGAQAGLDPGPAQAGAAVFLRAQRQGQAHGFDLVPQGRVDALALGANPRFAVHARGEQAPDLFGEHPADVDCFVHFSPRFLAMMPRRISRVPPRIEKVGAVCTSCASSSLSRSAWMAAGGSSSSR